LPVVLTLLLAACTAVVRLLWRAAPGRLAPAWLLALVLACGSLPARAWDASLMRAAAQRLGPGAVAAIGPLQALMSDARAADELSRLVVVNRFFNHQVQFRPDTEIWGQEDYWASPLQTLAMGRGDCEDFVIAKYAVLLAVDVPMERMRLVYVRARLPDQGAPVPHMVLAYYPAPGAEPLILDNLRPEVVPASQRPDLAPVFSFNSAGLWQGVAGVSAGDPMARLSRWRDVWQRTRLEGFP
jgi:predicted transglutaminase-like cysteine proteinase